MSAFDPKRTLTGNSATSALPLKADISLPDRHADNLEPSEQGNSIPKNLIVGW
jgi:hypothetical protein